MTEPNRLGWVTNLTLSQDYDYIDMSSFGRGTKDFIRGAAGVRFQLEGIAAGTDALVRELHSWVENGIYAPSHQSEWRCLYCASPNDIKRTHCCKCGAPRNFILG